MQRLEEAATAMEESGLRAEWLKDADEPIRKIAGKTNLPLFHTLMCASGHVDPECAFLLCDGAVSYSRYPLKIFSAIVQELTL